MKKPVFLLFFVFLFLTSCHKEPLRKWHEYEVVDYSGSIISTSHNEVKNYGYFDVSQSLLSVAAEDAELEERINLKISQFYEVLQTSVKRLYDNLLLDYYNESGWYHISAGCYETYNRNGLYSISCVMEYSYYGDNIKVYLGAATWNLGTGEETELFDLLVLSKTEYENFLTEIMSPGFEDGNLSLGGRYSEYISYYLTDDGVRVFFEDSGWENYNNTYSETIIFSEVPMMFKYDIELTSD